MNRRPDLLALLRPAPNSLLFVLAVLACLLLAPARAATLELTQLPERATIGSWLDMAATSDDNLSPGELLNGYLPAGNVSWQRNDRDDIALGLSSRIWWLRLRVHNGGAGQFRVLELSRATLGSVGLYSRMPGGRWSWRETGAQAASPRGDVEAPGYAFKLWLPAGNSEHLIRLKSSYAIHSPILLSSENATLREAQNGAGWFGFALGVLAGMLLVLPLLRPAHVSSRLSIAFCTIQAALILFALADRGVLGAWWVALPGVQHGLLQLSILLLQMAYVWFTMLFLLERKALSEAWHNALMTLLGVQATMLMLSVVITRQEVIAVLALLPVLSALVVTGACLAPMRARVAGASLLFAAGAALLLTRMALALNLTPLLPLPLEPYQWLLGFHILHGGLLLCALHQRPLPVSAQATSTDKRPAPAPTPLPTPRPAVEAGGDELRLPLRVLVVEDNTWVQQVIVGLLRKQGVETITAITGMEALTVLEREKLDLVLMDCDLPELDGLSATQVWRQRERELRRPPLPILAVTAHVSELQRQQALDAGMNDFLAKPVDMRTLRDAMIYWTAPERPAQATDKGPSDVT